MSTLIRLRNGLSRLALNAVPRSQRLSTMVGMTRAGRVALRAPDVPYGTAALTFLVSHGIRFDPRTTVTGDGPLEATRAAGQPMLVLGLHHSETNIAFRWLRAWALERDLEHAPLVRGGTASVIGTRDTYPALDPLLPVLTKVRDVWRRGGLVGAMNDLREPGERRTVAVTRGPYTVRFSTAMLDLAEQCGVPVFFIAGRIRRRHVGVEIVRPEVWDAPDVPDRAPGWTSRAYTAFVVREMERRLAG